MHFMITLSLLLNVAILVPVCLGLLADAAWAKDVYGVRTQARDILLSIYVAIAAVSIILIFADRPQAVGALLLVQIIYKITTPFTVRTVKNPVVISNLLIAAFHSITLIATPSLRGN
ncbi:hypothetical protein BH10ACI2_BH10ACI2_23820 [soil metagenome]